AGVEDEREIAVGKLRGLGGLPRRDEPGAPRRKGLRVEVPRAGVIRGRARPLDAPLAVETRVREAGEKRGERGHLVEDVGGPRVVALAADVDPHPPCDARGELARDPPVRTRLPRRRPTLAPAPDPP